jgi:4-hydroxy-3-methylbut-2-enyl diphosphate reductase
VKILLAQPRGFCAGVDRAIEIVERALTMFGAPVFVRHEIVHNRHVVASLKEKGAVFIDEVDDAPDDALLIFSAHGVSRDVRQAALNRGLHIIDATCPLVTKVHLDLVRHAKHGRQIILIGHAGHPEVEGTMGQAAAGVVLLVSSAEEVQNLVVNDEEKLAYVTQTTLSVDDTADVIAALRQRFPHIQVPKREGICYATSNRQTAVKQLAQQCDIVLVIGSQNSSNSQRLCETAKRGGAASWLIDDASQIQTAWLDGVTCVGVTAGASAPERLVEEVVAHLQTLGATEVELSSTTEENIVFRLPAELMGMEQHRR